MGQNYKPLITTHLDSVTAVTVTLDGKRAISGSEDKTLKVWDLQWGTELFTLQGHTSFIRTVAVTPDGRLAISGSEDETLKVWDLQRKIELYTLEGHTSTVRSVVVTPNGQRAISVSFDNTLKVWDLKQGKGIVSFTGDSPLSSCTVTPNGAMIIAGDDLGKVHFLQLEGV